MPPSDPRRPARWPLLPRFQFSLGWLLIAVAVVAIVLGIAASFRDFVGAIFIAFVCGVLPTPFVIALIYGRGDVRVFAIGALVPWVGMIPMGYTMTIWLLILPVISGVVAVVSRRAIQWLDGRGGRL